MLLEIIAGADQGRSYELADDGELLVGRDGQAHIRLADDQCSRRHARLVSELGAASVVDEGSRNGVFVNGVRCRRAALTAGDEIRIGSTILRVGDAPPEPCPGGATAVSVSEGPASVLATVNHASADLLSGTAAPLLPHETDQEHHILRQLCEITQVVAAHHELQAVMRGILDRARDALRADTACVLEPGTRGAWTIRAASSAAADGSAVTVSRTIVEESIREGIAILCTDPLNDARFSPSESIVALELSSAICSPVKVGQEFMGVLFLDRRTEGQVFNALDLRFAATVGNLLGMLLEREQLQLAARRRERLATIGEVMAGMAHCIKNVITGMQFGVSNLKALLRNGKFDAAAAYVDTVAAQERRISELVLDMLSYAKERRPVRAEVDVQAVIDSGLAPFRAEMEKRGIAVSVEVDAACPPLWAEEKALHRVFLNLLTNALEALEAKPKAAAKAIHVSVRPAPGQPGVEIRFRDTGIGIPASNQAKVFDVFFSSKGAQGTGLGLAVVQKIVQEHGGSIAVDSLENEWTEFRVTLPAGAREAPRETDGRRATGEA